MPAGERAPASDALALGGWVIPRTSSRAGLCAATTALSVSLAALSDFPDLPASASPIFLL